MHLGFYVFQETLPLAEVASGDPYSRLPQHQVAPCILLLTTLH